MSQRGTMRTILATEICEALAADGIALQKGQRSHLNAWITKHIQEIYDASLESHLQHNHEPKDFQHDEDLLNDLLLELNDRDAVPTKRMQESVKDIMKTYAMQMLRRYAV
jgi:hypothetical protein